MMIPESTISFEEFTGLTYAQCVERFGMSPMYEYRQGINYAVIKKSGLRTLLSNAAAAAYNLRGGFIDPKERLETCNKCPLLDRGRCTRCGCFIAAKARIRLERCPEGKWSS